MTITLPAQRLKWVADNLDSDLEGEDLLALDYSGRGMFGQRCIGIIGDNSTLLAFVRGITEDYHDDPDAWPNEFDSSMLDKVRTDSMGHDTIYYWPQFTVEGE